MAKRDYRWVRVRTLRAEEKSAIGAACERLIAENLKPRFLPAIRPNQFNYPIDLCGRWRGSNYTFFVRYRSGYAENLGAEFDSPFARIDHDEESLEELRFHVMWHRHTGRWWPLHRSVPLASALRFVATDEVLAPT